MRTLTLPLLLLAPAIAFAAPWVYDSTAQTLTRGTVVLQNVVADGASLTIKDNKSNATAVDVDLSEGVADGYAVVKIDDAAFNGNSSITNVVFPGTLVTIGNGAFRSCANLACAVSLPSSLAGSLSRTFRESPVTGDIVVPDGVTTMQETFCKTKITSLVCGTGLAAVQGGDGLCQSCTTLTNVVFQSGCRLGQNEFYGCTALTQATALPATTLADFCYMGMFSGCTALQNPPAISATTLAMNSCMNMFSDCTSLKESPELKAQTLSQYCYSMMFSRCTSLKKITCTASNLSAENALMDWVDGVPSGAGGTFVKKSGVTWPSGSSGIPTGWTVQQQ